MARVFVLQFAMCLICLFPGCSKEIPSNGPDTASAVNGTQPVSRRDKYRFRGSNGREQFDISVLVADLRGSNSSDRIAAAKVIPYDAPSNFEPAVEPLIAMLSSTSEAEKQAAAKGISNLAFNSSSLYKAFQSLKLIVEGQGPEETRRWATIAVAEIGPFLANEQQRKVIEFLQETSNDTSYDIARFAMDGLGDFGPSAEVAIPSVLLQLDAGQHRSLIAAKALEKIHRRPALCVPKLITAIERTPEWTEEILRALGAFQTDAAPAVPTIRGSLKSRDGNILIAAACALAAIGPAAESATDDLYQAFSSRKDPAGVIHDEARIALFYAMNSVGPNGKEKASKILGQIHGLRLFRDSRLPIRPEAIIEGITNSSTITTLLLSGSGLSDGDLAPVATLVSLEELAVPETITNEGLRHINGLARLKILTQDLWDRGDVRGDILDDRALIHLQNCPRLQNFSLRIKLSGKGTQHLAGCTGLKSLTVLEMNDEAVRNLPELKHLDTLYINDGAVTDAGVDALKKFSTLRHLALRSTDVTDAGIEQLVQNHPKLISLNLAHVNVTEASSLALSQLKELKELVVYATPLAGSRDVFDMSMTPAVVQLRRALPDCNVIYAD